MKSFFLSAAALASTSVLASPVTKRDFDFDAFVTAIAEAFPANVTIDAGCDLITDTEQDLADAFGIETTSDRSGCSDVTLIFARGTCDPGNLGALVGPPFVDALQQTLGDGVSLAVQGVPYPASVDGYLNDDPSGGETMAGLIQDTQSECPDTQLVLGGYSQGGYVVHNAATALDGTDAMSKVSAVVIFGDPDSAEAVDGVDSSKTDVICHDGDDICQQGVIILTQHLTYAIDALDAASFVQDNLSL